MSITADAYHGVDGSVDWSSALAAVVAAPDQPVLVAQPIVELAGGTVAGYELLSRFTAPPDAPPDVWFAHADQLGYAPALTARVISAALALLPTLPTGTFLTVNVEPHLVSHPAVLDALRAGGRLDRVVVELTEQVRAPAERALRRTLDEIRAAGGLIAVDDAGSGYAGLGQLLSIRPDIVKLDRDLITRVDTDLTRRAVVQLLGDLSGRMGCRLLAEGVETLGELQMLASLQVPLAQGWLLGRPSAPWAPLSAGTARLVRDLAPQVALDDHVAHLVRDCPMLERASVIVESVCDEPAGTAIVDELGRPIGVVVPDPLGRTRIAPVLVVAPSSTAADLVRRAMGRPSWHRGTPLACTDANGRLIGLIDVAELTEAALSPRRSCDLGHLGQLWVSQVSKIAEGGRGA